MKVIKLGSLLVASLFVMNSFGQAEGRPEKRQSHKADVSQQEKQTPEEKAKFQTERLNELLSLTADQKAKIYETNLAVNMKNEAVETHPTWTKEQKQEAFEGNKAGRSQVIKSYLTKEQLAKYEERESQNADKSHDGHNHDGMDHKH